MSQADTHPPPAYPSEADAQRARNLPAAARLWARDRGIYNLHETVVYFDAHPDELAPFLTPEHYQAKRDEHEAVAIFFRDGLRRQHFEAVAKAFYAHQADRACGHVHVVTRSADRAPRRQHVAAASKSTRGPTSPGSSGEDDDPDPPGLQVGPGSWLPDEQVEPPSDVSQPTKSVAS